MVVVVCGFRYEVPMTVEAVQWFFLFNQRKHQEMQLFLVSRVYSTSVKIPLERPRSACKQAPVNKNYIGYARVSTDLIRQGVSMDNQQVVIRNFVAHLNGTLLEIITEEVSGQDDAREGLERAIQLCKKTGSILVVSTLSRLGRSVRKIQNILDSEVEFICVDFPQGTRMHYQMLAVFAEYEAKCIGERVSRCIQHLKTTQGRVFGSKKIKDVQKRGVEGNRKAAMDYNQDIVPMVQGLRSNGSTLTQIAQRLNSLRIKTRYNKEWSCTAVWRLLNHSQVTTN